MLPLRELNRPDESVFVARLLIIINAVVFLLHWLAWFAAGGHDTWSFRMGVVPHCYFSPSSCGIAVPGNTDQLWKPLFTAMFLHGDILHLGFNMLFLAVFGGGVERRLGPWRFLLFYFGCGIAASLAQIITSPTSYAPMIGASGAIAGVMGAYFILQPKSWILAYIPPIFLIPVPALLFLLIWIAGQLLSVFTHLPGLTLNREGDNIAWMAHVGGFLAGATVGWSIKPWWKSRNAGVP